MKPNRTKGSVLGLLLLPGLMMAYAPAIGQTTNTFPANGNVGIGTTSPGSRLEIVSPNTNGWLVTSKAVSPSVGQINGIKLLSGYPGENYKWAGIASVSESGHSNLTGMALYAGQSERIRIASGGNVGIGTTTPQAKLAVNGNILAREVKVKTDIAVPDYVFEEGYKLPDLRELEAYVKLNKHLPEVPSAAEIGRDGLDLASMNLLLLKKVEELTLLLIESKTEAQYGKMEAGQMRISAELLMTLARHYGISADCFLIDGHEPPDHPSLLREEISLLKRQNQQLMESLAIYEKLICHLEFALEEGKVNVSFLRLVPPR